MSSTSELQQKEASLLCRTYGRYPLSVTRAKGSRLWDAEGKEYVDLLAGIAVTSLGHCHDELSEVLAEQCRRLVHVSNLFYQEEQLVLAQALLDTCHMGKVFFCNSGAESNEAAIKLARRYSQKVKNTQAFEIITLSGAFHGRTLATVAATGQARFQDGFAPIPTGFVNVPWGNIQTLEAAIGPQTAGIMVEIVQGEGGIRPMAAEYATAIEQLCRKHNILLIADEVQCGLCRSGKFWGFQNFDLKPDIFTTSKALANGLPLGGMLCTDEVAEGFAVGSHATTFGGGALITAVGGKVLEIMQRDALAQRAYTLGEQSKGLFRTMQASLPIKEVRGMGLLLGVELDLPGEKCQEIWKALLADGFVLNLTQGTTLRLLPALTIDFKDIEKFAQSLENILKKA